MARANFERARELYPSCDMGFDAWLAFFNTGEGTRALGKIIYDIYDEVKAQEEKSGGVRRMGRRPGRPVVPLDEVMGVVMPARFTSEPFPVALRQLIGGRSQRSFAYRIPCSQPHLARLLSGERTPDLEMLERIADAAKVDPWYFPEWRALFLGQLFTATFTAKPNMSITALRSVGGARRRQEGLA